MEFEKRDNHFAFKLLIIIILLGVSQFMLITNYLDLPPLTNLERNHIYRTYNDINIVNVDKSFWVISNVDNNISGIENIIIWIFMLWGFMKCIDLMFFLEKYK